MKYLGEYKPDYYDGYNWHNAYVYCPAETGDEAMHCLHYEPIDNIEWMCRSCSGDTCQRREDDIHQHIIRL
jgi:hypothetical protein